MSREHPQNPFSPYADDDIEERLKEFKLEMHPEESENLYYKDSMHRKDYRRISFAFL